MPYRRFYPAILCAAMSLALAACTTETPKEDPKGIDSQTVVTNEDSAAPSGRMVVPSAAFQAGDTLVRYDNGNLSVPFPRTAPGMQRLGVWFSRPSQKACTLREVHATFVPSELPRTATILIYETVPESGPTKQVGPLRDSLPIAIPAAGGAMVFDLSQRFIIASPQTDFFIAIEQTDAGRQVGPFLMGDGESSHQPDRSYIASGGTRQSPAGIDNIGTDLGIRAVMNCGIPIVTPPSDSSYSIDLRWDKSNVDLDLYLVRSSGDTIYWGKRGTDSTRRLDVDVISGFGPEKITFRPAPSPAETLKVAVYYHGPKGGPATRAVLTSRTNGVIVRRDTCVLRPSTWWNAGRKVTPSGQWFGGKCDTISVPALATRKKTVGK